MVSAKRDFPSDYLLIATGPRTAGRSSCRSLRNTCISLGQRISWCKGSGANPSHLIPTLDGMEADVVFKQR
jgi:hypothetical protein